MCYHFQPIVLNNNNLEKKRHLGNKKMLHSVQAAGYSLVSPYIEGAKDIYAGFSRKQTRSLPERVGLIAYAVFFKMIPGINYTVAILGFIAKKMTRIKTTPSTLHSEPKTGAMPTIKIIPLPQSSENSKAKETHVMFADGVKPGETSIYDKKKLEHATLTKSISTQTDSPVEQPSKTAPTETVTVRRSEASPTGTVIKILFFLWAFDYMVYAPYRAYISQCPITPCDMGHWDNTI